MDTSTWRVGWINKTWKYFVSVWTTESNIRVSNFLPLFWQLQNQIYIDSEKLQQLSCSERQAKQSSWCFSQLYSCLCSYCSKEDWNQGNPSVWLLGGGGPGTYKMGMHRMRTLKKNPWVSRWKETFCMSRDASMTLKSGCTDSGLFSWQ